MAFWTRTGLHVAWAVATGWLAGCGAPAEAAAPRGPIPPHTAQPRNAEPPARDATQRGASEIAIERGAVVLGSRAGSPLRNPSFEADLVAVELPPFSIDALPFPNEPGKPARTALGRDQAAALCQSAGKRLCTELEWERACKGPAGSTFATGESLELSRCKAQPSSCRSSEGVLGLGIALREWTASDAAGGLGHPLRTAVVRGATLEAENAAHRCAARSGVTPDSHGDDLGFRCCRGSTPSLAYPVEPERAFVRPLGLDAKRARAALEQIPQLRALAASFTPFTDADVDAALRRGGASRTGIAVWQFQSPSVAWSPLPGEELHILTGRTDRGALLAVLHAAADGRLTHAASTVITEPDTTLAIGGSSEHPRQLIFTTCYGCPGEGGTIRFGDDARVELGYR